jgi:hypothetical protein
VVEVQRLTVLLAVLSAGCGSTGTPQAPSGDAGTDADPIGDLCPDPTHPRVHYRSMNPNDCMGIVLDCTTEQNGFQNACGCGCIDKGDPMCPTVSDPMITWKSRDPSQCGTTVPSCPLGQIGFSNTCGCGCVSH